MSSYHEEQRRKMILRLRDLLLELPELNLRQQKERVWDMPMT